MLVPTHSSCQAPLRSVILGVPVVVLSLFAWCAPAKAAVTTIINDGDFAPQNWTVSPLGDASLDQINVNRRDGQSRGGPDSLTCIPRR